MNATTLHSRGMSTLDFIMSAVTLTSVPFSSWWWPKSIGLLCQCPNRWPRCRVRGGASHFSRVPPYQPHSTSAMSQKDAIECMCRGCGRRNYCSEDSSGRGFIELVIVEARSSIRNWGGFAETTFKVLPRLVRTRFNCARAVRHLRISG